MRRPTAALVLLLALAAGPAAGQGSRQPDRLQNPAGDSVLVWRDSRALSEGFRLINAGVHRSQPTLLVPLIACVADNGTDMVVTDSGFASSTILVVAGRQSGCRGVVPNEMIARRR
jgi:hypothetical protein